MHQTPVLQRAPRTQLPPFFCRSFRVPRLRRAAGHVGQVLDLRTVQHWGKGGRLRSVERQLNPAFPGAPPPRPLRWPLTVARQWAPPPERGHQHLGPEPPERAPPCAPRPRPFLVLLFLVIGQSVRVATRLIRFAPDFCLQARP